MASALCSKGRFILTKEHIPICKRKFSSFHDLKISLVRKSLEAIDQQS